MNILVPQLENLVRYHLKYKGEKTSILDEDLIEMEIGLSCLVEREEMKTFFGKNLNF